MDLVLYSAELAGTVAFALSGAILAAHKGLDLFGIVLLSIITALGGGTVRDVLLAGLPAVFEQLWVLYLGGNIVFLIYDYGFSKLVMFYAARIDKAIRRR